MNRQQAIDLIASILWHNGQGTRSSGPKVAGAIVDRLVRDGALQLAPAGNTVGVGQPHHEPTGPSIVDNTVVCSTCLKPVVARSSDDGDSAWLEHS